MRIAYAMLGISIAFLSGCTMSPTTEQVAAFGEAAQAVSDDFKGAYQLRADMVKAADIDRRARAYLTSADILLPTSPAPKLGKEFDEQIALIDSYAKYFKALSKATDPAQFDKLQAAADGYASSMNKLVGNLAAITGTPSAIPLPVIGPALQLISFTGVNLVEYESRRRVRALIEQMDLVVALGASKLIQDIEADKEILVKTYRAWHSAKIELLIAVKQRNEPGYVHFIEADAIARDYLTRLKILDDAGRDLYTLMDAHASLLDDSDDAEEKFAKFSDFANRLSALKEALK